MGRALGHAHNTYLNVLGESGLVGLIAYAALWTTTVVWVWRRARAGCAMALAGGRWLAAVSACWDLCFILSVHNLVDNLFIAGMVVYIGLWLALVHMTVME